MAKYFFRAGKLTIYVLMPLIITGLIIWAFCRQSYAQLDTVQSPFSELDTLAQEYYYNGQHKEAEQIWLSLVQSYPGTETEKQATESLIFFYARTGQDPNTFAMLTDYLTSYTEEDASAVIVGQTADIYQQRKEYGVAKTLHQSVYQKWPNTEQAMVSLAGQAFAVMSLGDDPNSTATTDLLISEYGENPKITQVLCDLADKYCDKGYLRQAYDIYETIDQGWIGDDQQIIAQASMTALSNIGFGVDPNNLPVISELAKTNLKSTNLGSALVQASDIYYTEATKTAPEKWQRQDYLYQTIEACQLAMENADDPEISAKACYQLAECYRLLGQDETAKSYYGQVVSNWPDFEYAWNAQYMMGCCSENLSRDGLMNSILAESDCLRAYMTVCKNYPACPAAKAASNWLKSHGIIND